LPAKPSGEPVPKAPAPSANTRQAEPNPPDPLADSTIPPATQADEFQFKQFRYVGNTIYSDSSLNAWLKRLVPKVRTLADLQGAAEAVADRYQQDGVLARVDLLPQDLTDGVVTITITEGVFEGARMETSPSTKLPADHLIKLVESAQPVNAPVTLSQMDKATLLLNEVPGVQASVRLASGLVEGQTQALIQSQDKRFWDSQVTADNTGATATGRWRLSSQFNLYGLLGRADASQLQYLRSQGLDYLRLGYSEALGQAGARWGGSTEFTRYRVVDPSYDALDLHGPAQAINFFVNQPLIRRRELSSDLMLSGDHKNYTNYSVFSTSRYQLDAISVSLQMNQRDNWLGGGNNNVNLQFSRGLVDYESARTDGTQGFFTKWRFNANRSQKLDDLQQLYVSFQRQVASGNLDSSEKMGIGGSSGVRSYPSGEASGSQATLFSLELQRDVNWQQQTYKLSTFYDFGEVEKEKFPTSTALNQYKLQGVGLWMGASYPNRWGQSQWRVTLARRLGSNPAAVNGQDSDGTYILNRFWLSASQVF
jgi:hemolysin activation/secretion protein